MCQKRSPSSMGWAKRRAMKARRRAARMIARRVGLGINRDSAVGRENTSFLGLGAIIGVMCEMEVVGLRLLCPGRGAFPSRAGQARRRQGGGGRIWVRGRWGIV